MGITLHKELGVNPRLLICPVCWKESNGIALCGTANKIYECGPCDLHYIGPPSRCPKCNMYGTHVRELGEHEKLMDQQPCDKCQKMQKDADDEVKAGGIYWKCKKCKSEGAVKRGTELAINIRKHFKLDPPEPCGIEWDECPVCTGTEDEFIAKED